MKKLSLFLLIFTLLLIPLFADGGNLPSNATLQLNSRVNAVFLHGFFSNSILLGDANDVTPTNILGQFAESGIFVEGAVYTDIIAKKDQTLGSDDIDDFDFGEPQYAIGYYLFLTNIMGNYTVNFAISPFYSTTTNFTVPWTLKIDYAGGNHTYLPTSSELASGGELGFNVANTALGHDVLETGTASVHKFGALELTMVSKFGETEGEVQLGAAMIPASDDYGATVVASITGP